MSMFKTFFGMAYTYRYLMQDTPTSTASVIQVYLFGSANT
jgi:hypothetical protein